MKAVAYDRYGPPEVLYFRYVPKPIPDRQQVLVKVKFAGLLPYDWRYMRAKPRIVRLASGLFKPKRKILGLDFSGIVEAVGNDVTQFSPGDSVYGIAPEAFAEYVSTKNCQIVSKPENISFEKAAVVTASAITALQSLRDHGSIKSGDAVLINGASGGVGTFAVQLAKHFGASVTGVCSGRNSEMVRSIGADQVLNYEQTDVTQHKNAYDLIVDAVGNHSIAAYKSMLKPNGRIVAVAGPVRRLLWLALPGRKRAVSMIGKPNLKDHELLRKMLTDGKIDPVMDHIFAFKDFREAVAYLETGRARGKVAMKIAD